MKEQLSDTVSDRIQALQRQSRQLLDLPPAKALNRILKAPQPAALVHAMAMQDYYLLVNEIGPTDALDLLALASDRQLDYILDMELWEKDQIMPAATHAWLACLLQADSTRTIQWLFRQNPEFLAYYLHENTDVVVREYDQDPKEIPEDFFSLDDIYFFRSRLAPPLADETEETPAQKDDLVTALLKAMAHTDYPLFRQIMIDATAVLKPEAEEQLYRMRSMRLAEAGMLPFDEAVGIYQPLTDRQLADLTVAARQPARVRPLEPTFSALVPVLDMPADSLFAAALARITDTNRRMDLQSQFAALCNRLLAADLVIVRRRQDLQATLQKSGNYLSIGLARLCSDAANMENQAAEALENLPLASLFRAGYGAVLELKHRAQRFEQNSWGRQNDLPLTFWGEKWMGILGGVLLKRPLFYDPVGAGQGPYREFTSIDEIETTRTALQAISGFDRLLNRLEPKIPFPLPGQPLTCQNIVWTLFARTQLDLPLKVEPIRVDAFRPFFEKLWQRAHPDRLRDEVAETLVAWLARSCQYSTDEVLALAGDGISNLFKAAADELGPVAPEELDPRFITLFLLKS